ncbi:FecR family protein [Steroidobacter sp.]|uniref:FecR family protein n=1 Tax=Steroidobacter sp. TaxID=1978227 RepID=UPI001A56EBFF|nr:FecR domain-containing protein [Steroidobacter sp.]MBL8266541.1 FecR domain-containing protein [Steroidobacter sp.]
MNKQITDEAAEWLIEIQMDQPDAGMRERFSAWLDTSPEHVRAYLELTALWEDANGVDKYRQVDVDALMQAARSESNLSSLVSASISERGARSSTGLRHPAPEDRKRARPMALAASIAVLTVGAAAAGYWHSVLRGVYSTAVGEQRTLALADGTTVELNAATRIRERFTEAERTVDLLEGQALFRVAKNPARPFVVRSDTATVRAIGTEFDVHRRVSGTTVTVIEGRVVVSPAESNDASSGAAVQELSKQASRVAGASPSVASEVFLGAGEQLNLHERGGTDAPRQTDTKLVTAWTQQRLEFEFTDLLDVAADFNRFNTRKLVVDARGLEDFKVSGTFQALDPKSLERFVQFLRAQPGVSVQQRGDEIVVAKNR